MSESETASCVHLYRHVRSAETPRAIGLPTGGRLITGGTEHTLFCERCGAVKVVVTGAVVTEGEADYYYRLGWRNGASMGATWLELYGKADERLAKDFRRAMEDAATHRGYSPMLRRDGKRAGSDDADAPAPPAPGD